MKIKYIVSSLIMAMLIIYGCQKQNDDVVEPLNTSKNLSETTRKIINFKNNMQKAKAGFYSVKSGEGMVAADSAEWYLEAAINYTFNEPYDVTPNLSWKSKSTTISITEEGKIDMVQLAEAYDALKSEIVSDDEFLAIADISILEDGNKASSRDIVLTAATALKSAPPPPTTPFDINFQDYWHWNGDWKWLETGEVYVPFVGSGYCDPPNNQIINNRAATDILESHNRPLIMLQLGQYWVDVANFYIHPADPEYAEPNEIWFDLENAYLLENTGNADFEWLIYRNETFDGDPCMSPTEMDFYINHGLKTLAERLRPANTVFSGLITTPEAHWGEPGFKNILAHSMRLFYGRAEYETGGE